jgi:hypothetical protein
MKGAVRLFVGAPISLASVRAIGGAVVAMGKAAEAARLRVRWLSPVTYHVTLKFIGWTRAEAMPAIEDALASALAGARAFPIAVGGAGAFPSAGRGRVMWIGVDDAGGGLARLAAKIEEALLRGDARAVCAWIPASIGAASSSAAPCRTVGTSTPGSARRSAWAPPRRPSGRSPRWPPTPTASAFSRSSRASGVRAGWRRREV